MKARLSRLLSFLVLLSMLLSACASPTTAPVATEAPAAPTPTAVPEPVEAPTPTAEPLQPASPAALDSAFSSLLGTMDSYNIMTLKDLAIQLVEGSRLFLLDVRQPEEVAKSGHIKGAVMIPLGELPTNLDKLPSLDTPIVAYCGSGWRCTIAMTALSALGWEQVTALKENSYTGWVNTGFGYEAGLPEEAPFLDAADPDPSLVLTMEEMFASIPKGWGAITAEQLAKARDENPDLVILDVRTSQEVKAGVTIPGALQIPLQEFIDRRAEWLAAQDTPIAVYCGSGHRSTMAMTILWSYGYTNVSSLKGGLPTWVAADLPVESGRPVAGNSQDEAFQAFLDRMVSYNTTSLDALQSALAEDTPPYLLDVRTTAEVEENGHIPGAILIPLRELMDHLDLLPAYDTPIVSYCGSGWRCTIAMPMLEALGWTNVRALKGGSYAGWVAAGYETIPGLPEPFEPLNAESPDPALVETFAGVLAAMPENYGGLAVGDLATELIENPELILIDVRTEAERQDAGVIEFENQIAIPLEELVTRKADWPADQGAKIVVYCGSGHRSTIAMSILWSYGYSDVRSMKGGFAEWLKAELPVAEAVAP